MLVGCHYRKHFAFLFWGKGVSQWVDTKCQRR